MYPDITINKDSKFFVAMCKDVDSVHSFISLGVEIDNKQVLLGSFGKILTGKASRCCFIFGETDGRVKNERLFFTKENKSIYSEMTYKAYSINWQNYLEFLHYMRLISLSQKASPLAAYCPTKETDSEITLGWQSIEDLPVDDNTKVSPENLEEFQHIGLSNTCRHSAISLTKRAGKLDDLGQGIFSSFTMSAPLKTKVLGGVLGVRGEHIYILPLPPASFSGISEKKAGIITKLYQRLDEILLNEQGNQSTIDKFEKIKALYESITAKETATLSEVINEITCWVSTNKKLISTHRKPHWISFSTATEKMFDKLLEENPVQDSGSKFN